MRVGYFEPIVVVAKEAGVLEITDTFPRFVVVTEAGSDEQPLARGSFVASRFREQYAA